MLNDRIQRAKWLLANVKHAAMATVNEDGTPHNTPYFFMCSRDLSELYWGSHPDSQHSRNILRNGQLFVVLYEATVGGGLYIRAQRGRIAEAGELERALMRHNELRAKHQKAPLPTHYYTDTSPQRMWSPRLHSFGSTLPTEMHRAFSCVTIGMKSRRVI